MNYLTTAIPTELQEMLFAIFCLFLFIVALLIVAHLYHWAGKTSQLLSNYMDSTDADDDDFLNASHFRSKQS